MSAKEEIPLSPLDADTIVEICFLINDLKHQLQHDEISQIQKILICDRIIQDKIDEMLSSFSPRQFSRNLTESRDVVNNILEIYQKADALEIPNKSAIKEILGKLQRLLNKISNPKD